MDAAPRERDMSRRGVEIFVGYLAEAAAVHRIGEVGAEPFQVEVLRTAPDLLVGSEGYHDLAVLDRIVGQQPLRHRQDLGDPRLVVRAEQSRAVGDDEPLTRVIFQKGKIGDPHDDIFIFAKKDIAAIVVHQARPDIFAGRGGGDVHMGDKTKDGGLRLHIRGNGGIKIAVLVEANLGEPHLPHLPLKQTRHIPDARRARAARALFVGGAGDTHILKQTFIRFHYSFSFLIPVINRKRRLYGRDRA